MLLQLGLFGLGIYCIVAGVLESSGLLPPPPPSDSGLTSVEVALALKGRSILHVGGPHRGGTTLLHSMLATHPQVGEFAVKDQSREVAGRGLEGPMSEGMFQQRVYPRFGIGLGATQRTLRMLGRAMRGLGWASPEPGGIGAYAFLPGAHLTEANETGLLSEASRLALFAQWGRLWPLGNASVTVFLEKSPVNIMLARWLAALWRLPPAEAVIVRFAMVSRHPLAVAEAQRRWKDAEHLSRRQLVEHWLIQQETLARDVLALGGAAAVHAVRYELLAAEPARTMERLFRWLGLRRPEEAARTAAEAAPPRRGANDKYAESFCSWLRSGGPAEREFRSMLEDLEPRIQAVHSEYSLALWADRC